MGWFRAIDRSPAVVSKPASFLAIALGACMHQHHSLLEPSLNTASYQDPGLWILFLMRTAVLKASVEAAKREGWLFEKVDRGVEVLIPNLEQVKTGLDMLEFPTIVFLATGYNVSTLQQAARRSWRIAQKADVDVFFLGYRGSARMACLDLMAKKIAVALASQLVS